MNMSTKPAEFVPAPDLARDVECDFAVHKTRLEAEKLADGRGLVEPHPPRRPRRGGQFLRVAVDRRR